MTGVTIYDVAKVAGVSHQTVSRYLRGSEHVRPETGERVQAALDALGYRLNSAARYLRSGRVNRLGVLAHRLDLSGPVRLLNGLTSAARERGYLLDIVAVDGNDAHDVSRALSLILGQQVAGVIAVAQSTLVTQAIAERGAELPMVSDVTVEGESPLNEIAGRVAAEHLTDLGHTRVGYLAGPLTWLAARHRQDGFAQAIAARGGSVLWQGEGDWSAASAYALGTSIPVRELGITAIGAGNDSMAIALIAALARRGLRVPDDVSVIGTDDVAEAQYLQPALSTVSVDQEGEGAHMLDSLVARIEGWPGAGVPPLQPPRLMARGSTTTR
ncbi:LacI family DNA-binding transcriptional regulator [Amnibacterium sp. CER49]|uniref:LacI family DNA-binding transcriptional regulator n=1 Tax=Amnibacterium sp. CER49 TaxID=3039161 RepID=UPI002448F80B|nr:LacI family DNA-binding transcriptional regulator [Amnibacterium sp. CER49]MDH2442589.1 LacI family DNA-binding transcriptional regulator [Amnibacterium sp. CER49]